MKLSPAIIRQFESDQDQHGTKVALSNVLWQQASSQLRDLGIKRVSTEYTKGKPDTPPEKD